MLGLPLLMLRMDVQGLPVLIHVSRKTHGLVSKVFLWPSLFKMNRSNDVQIWNSVVARADWYLRLPPKKAEVWEVCSSLPSASHSHRVTSVHIPWLMLATEGSLQLAYWCPKQNAGYIVKYVSYYLLMSVLIKQWELNGCFLIKTMIS